MRVCIDTNVLVRLFGRNQPFRPIRLMLTAGRLELAVSNEILSEYEESVTRLSGGDRWQQIERLLIFLFQLHANILFINPQFRFRVITADPDDNKFVDCAIAAQADYIITSDTHFNELRNAGYKPQPIAPEDFVRIHLGA